MEKTLAAPNRGEIAPAHDKLSQLVAQLGTVILDKGPVIERTVVTLLSRGHLLMEDVPGVGKTMLAKSLARSIAAKFTRIQFTPDLLPADVTGATVYDPVKREFHFQPGPVFTNILLADEINRTSPRTQSSLLEAMEEQQVTVDGVSHPLPELFFVIATQNPIEQQGTYPLPEAQLDRFLLKQAVGYPSAEQEVEMLKAQQFEHPIEHLSPILSPEEVLELQALTRKIHVSEPVLAYIVNLVRLTREHPDVQVGASPRGSLALRRAAQALALIRGMEYVIPEHVKELAPYVLAHRLILMSEAELSGVTPELIVEEVLEKAPVPLP